MDEIEKIRSQDEYRELYELATFIRNQKLLADAELESLARHREEVSSGAINLLTKAWRCSCWNNIGRQLKNRTLDPRIACKLLKKVDNTEALPAYKHIGRNFADLDHLLTVLYNEPLSVAKLLNNIDQNEAFFNDCAIQALFNMVYSCGLYPEDELRLAEVSFHLLKLQLLKSGDQMRIMLRKEISMSTRFYKHFVEQMHPTMVYLTQALRRSVLEVIQLGSFWLDIDSKQSTTRFLRDNNQNANRLPEYRALVVSKLVELVDNFLDSIWHALPMLPPNLNWIIRTIFVSLYDQLDDLSVIELSHACKDMIVSNFICPAIISPQKFGVVDNDVRIGTIVNHNLVQVAMLIQMISLREFETPPEEYQEFLKQCRKTHLISDMMDAILIEKPAPDVEIMSLISKKHLQTDVISKPYFVGSVADVNTLINLIRATSPSEDRNVSRILEICKKMPATLSSTTVSVQLETSNSIESSSSSFRNIHRKVQESFKRNVENTHEVQKQSFDEIGYLKKENFDLFFSEYLMQNYTHLDFHELDQTPSVKTVEDNSHCAETNASQLIGSPLPVNSVISSIDLSTPSNVSVGSSCETHIAIENRDRTESSINLEEKSSISKLKNLSILMKKSLSQSNTLSDIRGHLRRSGNLKKNENGISLSISEQSLSNVIGGPRDDILAKYAPFSSLKNNTSATLLIAIGEPSEKNDLIETYYAPDNIVSCRAFQDTVRKMITVLGNVSYLPKIGYRPKTFEMNNPSKKRLLKQFLDGVLVETEHRREYGQAAQLREVLRCIEMFDQNGIDLLLENLKMKEHELEQTIVDMRDDRTILMRKTNDIFSLEQRVLLNQRLTEEIIIDFLTKMFLETGFQNKNSIGKTPEVIAVLKFYDEFKNLQAHDERAEFLKNLLVFLKQRLLLNADWNYATNTMIQRAMTTIERCVMFSVYDAAFYPNKEIDQDKDKLLRLTIANLAETVSPGNDFLNIPKRLYGEAPWPSAQAELTMLDIYVTAQDKLNCVVRCCDVIANLIALSSKNAIASADDLIPILVFVIIKANPRALLSNVQFVETFAGDNIESGKNAYYWTNFKSAVEYIKTIL